MKKHFCTISTLDYLFKVRALHASLSKYADKFILFVLVVDEKNKDLIKIDEAQESLRVLYLRDLKILSNSKIVKNYLNDKDKLRWSLKPLFMKYLIAKKNLDKLIYVDNDIAFFNDFSFLFDYLNSYNILLTPHYYPRNPKQNQNWLEANFRVGLFNAGFVAVNKNATHMLEWWADCCEYRCEKNPMRGLFDDQKYLDLVPVIEPKTKILEHKGCNVAGWNVEICNRTKEANTGQILINDKWPVIFIHFSPITFKIFCDNDDPNLEPYFNEYISQLKKYKPDFKISNHTSIPTVLESIKIKIWLLLNYFHNWKNKKL